MVAKQSKWTAVLLLVLLAPVTAFAGAVGGTSARAVVEKFQAELIEVMKNGKTLGYAGRYDKLVKPVSESHDLVMIARVVVGKEWEKLTSEQQDKLVDVFSKLSVASYAHNFKEYGGESFVFESEEQTKRGGVVVHYLFKVPDEKSHKFDYWLKEKGDSWRIINIIADGVSDLALRRSEYTTILQREGFDALIAKINEKIDNYSKL
ncbi:ABC transporter substrate-binding protein [Methylomicrobium lacus]|uniref:ABC transporter substrate-binding protein n=1 Tax=Methylomicrobium lacus TaxID=136992 RepID=UPI0035A900BF